MSLLKFQSSFILSDLKISTVGNLNISWITGEMFFLNLSYFLNMEL